MSNAWVQIKNDAKMRKLHTVKALGRSIFTIPRGFSCDRNCDVMVQGLEEFYGTDHANRCSIVRRSANRWPAHEIVIHQVNRILAFDLGRGARKCNLIDPAATLGGWSTEEVDEGRKDNDSTRSHLLVTIAHLRIRFHFGCRDDCHNRRGVHYFNPGDEFARRAIWS